MRSAVKKIWVTFIIILVGGVLSLHFWMRDKLLKAAEKAEGGDQLIKAYENGEIGFFELGERIKHSNPKAQNAH